MIPLHLHSHKLSHDTCITRTPTMENPQKSPSLGILPSATPIRASFDAQADLDGFVWVKASSKSSTTSNIEQRALQPHQTFGDVEGQTLWMIRHSKYIDVYIYDDPHIDSVFSEFEELLPSLATGAYQVPIHLHLGSRDLSVLNMKRIIAVFRAEWSSNITRIYCAESALRRFAAQQFRCQFQLAEPGHALADVPTPSCDILGPPSTLSIHHELHSGAIIRSEGDVIVYGSVPRGAVLEAVGSITVIGGLYGEAHAGIMGDESAFILAMIFGPERVQIAHHRCYTDPIREPCLATQINVRDGQLSVTAFPIT